MNECVYACLYAWVYACLYAEPIDKTKLTQVVSLMCRGEFCEIGSYSKRNFITLKLLRN